MFGLRAQELLIILAALLLLFGATRLPQLAKALGSSVRNFKKGIASDEEEEAQAPHNTDQNNPKASGNKNLEAHAHATASQVNPAKIDSQH